MGEVWLASSAAGKLKLTEMYQKTDTSHKNISKPNRTPSIPLLITACAKCLGKRCKHRQSDFLHVLLPAQGAAIRQIKPI